MKHSAHSNHRSFEEFAKRIQWKKVWRRVLMVGAVLGGAAAFLGQGSCANSADTNAPDTPAVEPAQSEEESIYDVIVVGAGLSGLTTTLELGRAGVTVAVVDMASVFGGHAVMANGDLNIPDTPFQEARGIADSPARAQEDILRWGESEHHEWVRYYTRNARRDIFDWLTTLGVEFEDVLQGPGDSVRRVHLTKGRGIGLVAPVYRECLRWPNITFLWNRQVTGLERVEGRVRRVRIRELRTGNDRMLRARAVVLATGGFQSNLDMVRQYWARDLPFPERFLAGSGIHSVGEGHQLAEDAGGALGDMNLQMNLSSGIVDPRAEDGRRGLNAGNKAAVWVNREGRRFIDERTKPSNALPVVLEQPGKTFWAIFDAATRDRFRVSGSDWASFERIDKLILSNPDITRVGNDWRELAERTGLPEEQLQATMEDYNRMVEAGHDIEFGRFAPELETPPPPIRQPPFYAVRFFPLTRKSMGGVRVDLSCRVLDERQRVIPGLYAVGELTGSAGINGKSGMAGMFLGPCIVMGHVASRAILQEFGTPRTNRAMTPDPIAPEIRRVTPSQTAQCMQCHNILASAELRADGYRHFNAVHLKVLERGYNCADCHAEMTPSGSPEGHLIQARSLSFSCVSCHVAIE